MKRAAAERSGDLLPRPLGWACASPAQSSESDRPTGAFPGLTSSAVQARSPARWGALLLFRSRAGKAAGKPLPTSTLGESGGATGEGLRLQNKSHGWTVARCVPKQAKKAQMMKDVMLSRLVTTLCHNPSRGGCRKSRHPVGFSVSGQKLRDARE
jgi:hypothetical protein